VRPVTDVLKTGEWAGKRAFVIGSGPSLKNFDRSHLAGELTIACNEEYRLLRATINLVQDVRLFATPSDPGVVPLRDREDWYRGGAWPVYFKGHPDREDVDANDFIFQAKSCHTQDQLFRWGTSLEAGLTYGANVGLAALSLADVLGASPIYLLGFDCGFGPKRETHCHSHYPENWALPEKSQQEVFARWVDEFTRHAPSVRGKVVVCGPSALDCFKRISHGELIEELLK
jgi:hypothetical protein